MHPISNKGKRGRNERIEEGGGKKTERMKDREKERDRQTDRQTNRQTDIELHFIFHADERRLL